MICLHSDWSGDTIEKLKYVPVTDEHNTSGVRLAEGTANEVVRRTGA